MRLLGRKAIVTGGGRGIGRAVALGLAREGADVVVPYLRGSDAAELVAAEARGLGRDRSCAVRADVTTREDVERLVAHAVSRLGGLDILVNCAGQLERKAFLEMTDGELDEALAIYLKGPFMLGQAASRAMISAKSGGSIINFASILAERAVVNLTHYQSAKGGVLMLTRSMALELAHYGIRVNAISPGLTATDANRDQREGHPDVWKQRVSLIPIGRAGRPEDHVGAAVFLASDESAWVTGTVIAVDGGQTAV